MRRVEALQLDRVMVMRLAPGACMMPDVDADAPAEYFTRYQIALQSLPGALFHIAETVNFRLGRCPG